MGLDLNKLDVQNYLCWSVSLKYWGDNFYPSSKSAGTLTWLILSFSANFSSQVLVISLISFSDSWSLSCSTGACLFYISVNNNKKFQCLALLKFPYSINNRWQPFITLISCKGHIDQVPLKTYCFFLTCILSLIWSLNQLNSVESTGRLIIQS